MERSERDKREARSVVQVEGCHREGISSNKKESAPNAFWVKLPKGIGSCLWDILGWIRIQAWLDLEAQVVSVGSFFPWFFCFTPSSDSFFPCTFTRILDYRTLSS